MRRLKEAGYGARMHTYEYYVWKKGFVAVIFIQPYHGTVYVYGVPWNKKESEESLREIVNLLRDTDRSLNISTILH